MTGNEYQKFAMRTNDGKHTGRLLSLCDGFKAMEGEPGKAGDLGGILNGCLGLSGEVGEFNDMVKKWIFHEKPMDADHAKKELGDVLWYVAMICESFGWDMDEIMSMNIDKLKARYPEGFDVYLSSHHKAGDL